MTGNLMGSGVYALLKNEHLIGSRMEYLEDELFGVEDYSQKVVYIGQSTNFPSRLGRHIKDKNKEFDDYVFVEVPGSKKNLNAVEGTLIALYDKPLYNSNGYCLPLYMRNGKYTRMYSYEEDERSTAKEKFVHEALAVMAFIMPEELMEHLKLSPDDINRECRRRNRFGATKMYNILARYIWDNERRSDETD